MGNKSYVDFLNKITPKMYWYSNIHDYYLPTFEKLAALVHIEFEVFTPAYDYDGNIVENAVAIFIPDSCYSLIPRYDEAYFEFQKQYKERLQKKGYDISKLVGNIIFLGCETYYGLEKTNKELLDTTFIESFEIYR